LLAKSLPAAGLTEILGTRSGRFRPAGASILGQAAPSHAREPPRRSFCAVDALDARSNFEPIMQSVRDLNKLGDA
jgi:hypothetical protein